MENIKILQEGTNKEKLFAKTVISLSESQGLYGRVIRDVNEFSEENFAKFREDLNAKTINDALDVVYFVEV